MISRRFFARTGVRARNAIHTSKLLVLAAVLAAGAVPSAASAQGGGNGDVKVETETEKAIYLIGVDFAHRLRQVYQQLYLTDAEIAILGKGIKDGQDGSAMPLDPAVYGPKIQALRDERAKNAVALEAPKAAAYLEAQRKLPGAKELDSGMIFTSVEDGAGASPAIGSKVKVHYTGKLRDGTVFDSSSGRGQPVEFVIGKVIRCWNEALPMMKEGGKAKLVCPAKIAYGDTGIPGTIPPGAVLTFDVELIAVVE